MVRAGSKLRGACILVVEDEYLVADILVQLIERYGGTVAGPVAGKEAALAILATTPVDCAVLDVKLSDGSCVTLAQELARRDINVTLTTGYSDSGIPGEVRHLPTLTKPTDLEALVEHLAGYCSTTPSPATPA
jgi:DNA-binding NtrC family response regulator